MNSLYWSVRRELWENRSIYLAPLIGAGIVLVGLLLALVRLPARLQQAAPNSPELHQITDVPYVAAAIVLMAIQLVVAIFYSLDALYGERRDRSILFWKSMPVSDLTTVVSKASVPMLVLPVVTFVATVATQTVMLLVSSVVLAANGLSLSLLWDHLSLVEISRINFGHLVAFHGIWYAPLYAWLLLVSAWARRLPFLWATLPPIAIIVVERVAFNSAHFAVLLQTHFLGAPDAAPPAGMPAMTMEMLTTPVGGLLLSPALWVGLAVSAAFLFGAMRLRRIRGAM